jgi:hypothetical protein
MPVIEDTSNYFTISVLSTRHKRVQLTSVYFISKIISLSLFLLNLALDESYIGTFRSNLIPSLQETNRILFGLLTN